MEGALFAKPKQVLEIVVNVCLIAVSIAILVFVVVTLRDRFHSNDNSLAVGQKISLRGITQPVPNSRLLLVALQTECRFCKEEMPFYRELATRAAKSHARVAFVFAEPVTEARAFLRANNVDSPEVYRSDFRDIHVSGTPTLILIDENSKVVSDWVGKLPDDRHAEVFNRIGITE